MTFDLAGKENHAIAVQNVESVYKNLAKKSRLIANKVGDFLAANP
jgi:hypothetical protein